jgi:hypothetical protein
MGKSFEIRPTGVAHADLLIPGEWAPGYPKSLDPYAQDQVIEHFTWKKVTTNVSGFILANPTIDHYGEMTVGDTECLLAPLFTAVPRSRIIARRISVYLPSSPVVGAGRMRSRFLATSRMQQDESHMKLLDGGIANWSHGKSVTGAVT